MDTFFDSYDNYVGTCITFIIGLFFQLDYEYQKYIFNTYGNDLEYFDDFKSIVPCDVYDLIKNPEKCGFLDRFYEQTNEHNDNYLNVVVLKNIVPFGINFYKLLYMMSNDIDYRNFYIYKRNLTSKCTMVDAYNTNILDTIKKIIDKNFIFIFNILEYKNEYEQKDGMIGDIPKELYELYQSEDYKSSKYINAQELYIDWIKPIEPNDKENYLKLTSMAIGQKTTFINGIQYTDILCFRNFIHKEFKLNLKTLFGCEKDFEPELNSIPHLYTTYRIENQNNSNMIMILH